MTHNDHLFVPLTSSMGQNLVLFRDGITDSTDMSWDSEGQESLACWSPWGWSQTVRHDVATEQENWWFSSYKLPSIACQRRQWQPTPVLLPGKSHGQRSLVGCSPWGRWVRHDSATSLSLFTFMHRRIKWQPTPVFLPGESQGWRSIVGCRLWGHTESDTTEAT